MAEESQIKVGDVIAGFEILSKIAEGGMGTVYKARQVSLDRIVAIKILPPHLAKDDEFVRHFQEESRVAAKLKHPHLIEVYDAGKTDGTHYFAMEYVEGETVGDKMRRDGPFVEHLAVGICLNVAQALQYAWEKSKLIHGDIKPENLLIERETKKIRIGDLGLGKSLLGRSEEDIASDQRRGMGTPAYVCPEQARGDKHLDFRADMYALGATMYHMLTGKLPFDGMTPAETLAGHLHGTLPDPRKLHAAISENTVIVLERMMARDPDMRYPSWAALAHDLEQIHNARPPSVPPLAPDKSTLHREVQAATAVVKKKTSPVLIAVELIVILAGIAAFYWYVQMRPKQHPVTPPTTSVANAPPHAAGTGSSVAAPTSMSPREFLPSKLEGLRLWLSADKDVAHDAENRVSTWGDRSTNGVNATQNNPDARPVLVPNALHGKPVIRFDGTNDQLDFSPIPTSNFTVSIVFSISSMKPWAGPLNNRVATKPGFQIVSGDGSNQVYIPALVTWDGEEESSHQKASTYVDIPSKSTIHTWVYEGGSESQFFQDGVETSVGECISNFNITAACIGRGYDFMAADIAELVVYDRALSATELQEFQQYLETKYGLGTPIMNPTIAVPKVPSPLPTETKQPLPHPRAEDTKKTDEAHAKLMTEAENRYSVWRATFEEILSSGEYGRARETAMMAQTDPTFTLVKDKLARDERIAQMILDLRTTAWTNLLGQTYYVGTTPGTVVRLGSDKFWVKLAAGEIAVAFVNVDPTKIPSFALSKNRNDPKLNLSAALYSWYRGDKDIARVYFDAATKAGADVAAYLPSELSAPEPIPLPEPTPPPPSPGKEAAGAATTNVPGKFTMPPDDGMNMLVNHSFERWSGRTLIDWSTNNSQAKPDPDTGNVVDGKYSARFDFGPNQQSMQLEQPVHAQAGRKYRLQFFYRTMNFDGQIWVEIGAQGDPIPKLKQVMETSTDWQMMTVEMNVPSAANLMVRIRASNASSGSVWLDHFDLRPY